MNNIHIQVHTQMYAPASVLMKDALMCDLEWCEGCNFWVALPRQWQGTAKAGSRVAESCDGIGFLCEDASLWTHREASGIVAVKKKILNKWNCENVTFAARRREHFQGVLASFLLLNSLKKRYFSTQTFTRIFKLFAFTIKLFAFTSDSNYVNRNASLKRFPWIMFTTNK